MDRERFEQSIRNAILEVPKRIRDAMDNVAFVVEDEVRSARRSEELVRRGHVLLGLYQGIPLPRRGAGYSGVLPDKITIFKNVIEELAGFDDKRTTDLVRSTVHHEIAHHLGFDETAVQRWEARRRGKSSQNVEQH